MKKLLILGGILLALGCGIFMMLTRDYVVTLSETQLQEKLDEFFPIKKDFLIVFTVSLFNPRLHLHEGANRIDFQVNAVTKVKAKDRPLQGTCKISGKVNYNPATGEFYLDDSRVEKLEIENVPDKYSGIIFETANLAVQTFLDGRVLYTLKRSGFKQSVARFVLKEVRVEQGTLKITLAVKK